MTDSLKSREIIRKTAAARKASNMSDYHESYDGFRWSTARSLLEGLPGDHRNSAHEAVDRHLSTGHGNQIAMRWIAKSGDRTDFTYAELSSLTNRFANVLCANGLTKGDRVYALLGRVPELYIAALGTLKAGCVFCPRFSAFGPEPIKARMQICAANALVTSTRLYSRKVAGIRAALPTLKTVFPIDGNLPDTVALQSLMEAASSQFKTETTEPEDTALLHFTSGTTGKPKGVVHVHQAVVAHNATGQMALDLRPGDIDWCTADPGWVTGTSYGIIAPLTNRCTMIVDEAEFDVERWYDILSSEAVNVWYTAPTAIRMLMKNRRQSHGKSSFPQPALHGEVR